MNNSLFPEVFHSKYELREIFPQVHHVGKQLSILINRMIVIIREEILASEINKKEPAKFLFF